jgi:hypothetical protein
VSLLSFQGLVLGVSAERLSPLFYGGILVAFAYGCWLFFYEEAFVAFRGFGVGLALLQVVVFVGYTISNASVAARSLTFSTSFEGQVSQFLAKEPAGVVLANPELGSHLLYYGKDPVVCTMNIESGLAVREVYGALSGLDDSGFRALLRKYHVSYFVWKCSSPEAVEAFTRYCTYIVYGQRAVYKDPQAFFGGGLLSGAVKPVYLEALPRVGEYGIWRVLPDKL